MIDVYIPREGVMEISDKELVEERNRNVSRYNMWRIFILIEIALLSLCMVFSVTISLWFLFGIILFPIVYFSYRKLMKISERISPQISSLILIFNSNKDLQSMKIRKWMNNRANEYTEHSIRHNQAIGFKAIWTYSGKIIIEIIVDPDFPGNPIFETFDFYSLSEMIVLLEKVLPKADKWFYILEDGSEWPIEQKQELNNDVQTTKIPWNISDYFS